MEMIKIILGCAFLLCGMIIFAVEVYGIFKFGCALNRMHAAAMGDTLGIACMMVGLMIISGFNFTTLKMALVVVFLWFSSPVSSHLLAKLEITTFPALRQNAKVYDSVRDLEDEIREEE